MACLSIMTNDARQSDTAVGVEENRREWASRNLFLMGRKKKKKEIINIYISHIIKNTYRKPTVVCRHGHRATADPSSRLFFFFFPSLSLFHPLLVFRPKRYSNGKWMCFCVCVCCLYDDGDHWMAKTHPQSYQIPSLLLAAFRIHHTVANASPVVFSWKEIRPTRNRKKGGRRPGSPPLIHLIIDAGHAHPDKRERRIEEKCCLCQQPTCRFLFLMTRSGQRKLTKNWRKKRTKNKKCDWV